MNALLVLLGAAVGAPARYLVSLWVSGERATFAVNVTGSLLLGAVAGGGSPASFILLGVGFCGAFTTFSAYSVEAVLAGRRAGAGYVVASTVGCLAAAALGLQIGRALAG